MYSLSLIIGRCIGISFSLMWPIAKIYDGPEFVARQSRSDTMNNIN